LGQVEYCKQGVITRLLRDNSEVCDDDVDQWDKYYVNLLSIVSKPIIVTEFGGPNANIEPITETYQAMQLEKYLRQLAHLKITEAYLFTLVEGMFDNSAHSLSGLINGRNLTRKKLFKVFQQFSTNAQNM